MFPARSAYQACAVVSRLRQPSLGVRPDQLSRLPRRLGTAKVSETALQHGKSWDAKLMSSCTRMLRFKDPVHIRLRSPSRQSFRHMFCGRPEKQQEAPSLSSGCGRDEAIQASVLVLSVPLAEMLQDRERGRDYPKRSLQGARRVLSIRNLVTFDVPAMARWKQTQGVWRHQWNKYHQTSGTHFASSC